MSRGNHGSLETTLRLYAGGVSRGFGAAQRFVLEQLAEGREADPLAWVSARELAERRAGGVPSRSEVEAVRRAIRRLAAAGLVDHVHGDARWPLSDVERAAVIAQLDALEAGIPRRVQWSPASGPKNERQMRELSRVYGRRGPDAMRVVWSAVVENHEPKKITARVIREYADAYLELSAMPDR